MSYPGSPGRGMVWKTQASLPVRTSKARISPGGARYPSPVKAAHDDQVFEDSSRGPRRQRNRRAVDTGFQIQTAMVGEAVDQFPGAGVDGVHESAAVDKDSPVGMVRAFPVIGPAASDAASRPSIAESVHPEFFARGRVQRNQRALFRRYVRHVSDHQRTEAKATRPRPLRRSRQFRVC